MKKIALCALLVCMTATAGYANRNICNVSKVYDGYDATADEYLFPDEENYRIAKGISAEVYECDKINPTSCTDTEIITMPDGHYFQGVRYGQRTYKCDAMTIGNDKWEPFTPSAGEQYNICNKAKIYDGHDAKADEYLFKDEKNYGYASGKTSKVYECDKINPKSCTDQEYITMPDGHYFQGVRYGKRTYKCDAMTIGNDKWIPVDEGGVVVPPEPNPNYCDQFKAYPERYACCIMGNKTEWTTNDPANGQCRCKAPNTEWEYVNGHGKCKSKGLIGENCQRWKYDISLYSCCLESLKPGSDVDFDNGKCECLEPTKTWDGTKCVHNGIVPPEQEKTCYYSFDAEIRCANGAYIARSTSYPFVVNTNGKTCDDFKTTFASDRDFMLAMMDKFCSQQGSVPYRGNEQAFKEAAASLQAFFQSAKSSANVWKNEDGKFNTARLASDLTAGVVLGTVGGVVSGVVIKKKQVEKGFDALQCTVGGQKIADWGDEFEVSLRR